MLSRDELNRVNTALAAVQEASWFYRFLQQQHFPASEKSKSELVPTAAQRSQLKLAVGQLAQALGDLRIAIEPLLRALEDAESSSAGPPAPHRSA